MYKEMYGFSKLFQKDTGAKTFEDSSSKLKSFPEGEPRRAVTQHHSKTLQGRARPVFSSSLAPFTPAPSTQHRLLTLESHRLRWLQTQSRPQIPGYPWARYFNFLCLSFLIYKIIIFTASSISTTFSTTTTSF